MHCTALFTGSIASGECCMCFVDAVKSKGSGCGAGDDAPATDGSGGWTDILSACLPRMSHPNV